MSGRKAELRAKARARIAAMAPEEQASHGVEIASRLWSMPEMGEVATILLYASTAGEVPTDAIADTARRRGIEALYPRCPPGSSGMTLHLVESAQDLMPAGRFGIREPAESCLEVDPRTVDLVLLPGLGWDRAGHRLGRGAGYYDRLLSDPGWRGFRVGLFFAVQELQGIPFDEWDAPLDAVVTEREVVRFSR